MYCLVCRQKISRWRRLKTGSEFCSEEHLEQYQKEAVGRLLEYHESKSSQPADEDPIHRLALIDVGPTMAEEPRHLADLQPFKAMEVRRYNPARATNLWLFHNGSAIPPRPQLPLEVHPLTLWDPSLLAPARSSGPAAAPPLPLISRPAPDPIASLLKALPATTAGPVWVDLRLLDPGLPSLLARPLWEGPRLAGNGRLVHQPSLANPGGMPARSTGLGNARPVEHCLPLAIPLSPGGPPIEVAGSHLRICSAMPAICLVEPGVLDQAALSRPRRRAAGFRELAAAFREPDPQPWRVSDLGVWSDRPARPRYMPGALDQAVLVPARRRTAGFRELAGALRESEPQSWRPPDLGTLFHRPVHPVRMPSGPPPRNMAAMVRPPRVARPRVSTPLPPVPGELATAPAIWLGPRFLDRVGIRRIPAPAEPGPPLRRPEPPPPELNPVGVVQARGLTPAPEVARCRPLAPSVAPGAPTSIRTEAAPAPPPSAAHLLSGPLFPPQPVVRKLMAADKAGAWPSLADTRQAGPVPCGARPPEVRAQHLTPPRFVTVRRGPPAPAGQFIELKPHADKVGARQMLAPVPAGPGGSALQQVALPGPEPRTTAPLVRRTVKLPPPEPQPLVGRDADQGHIAMGALARADRLGKPVPDATVEQTADSLRLALEQSRRAREGLTARLPRQAALAWHEIVLPALASRRAKAGLVAALMLALSLWSFRDPKSMTNAALRWAVQPIQARSYFLLEENFQQGTNAWTNPEALLRRADGLVEIQTGLSLYRPSLERQDYEFGFSGLIRKGALGWVVRASDANNYYAFKLARQGTGRDRRSVLLRYAVINGAPADKPHVSAVPFDVEENKLYQVMVQVSGERVTTIISDRGVDSCADSRLMRGGVGFFAEPGETGLVHSLSVSGNDDPTGRAIVWVRDFYRFCTRQSSVTRAGK